MKARNIAFLLLAAGLTGSFMPALAGAGAAAGAADSPTGEDAIRAAVAKSLPLLERGARGSMEQRPQCFTCHNQGVPILALTTARSRGFAIDAEHLREQIKFTAGFLARNRENYRSGRGQGGQATTAGYALGTLADGGWKPDAATAAVAEYLLLYQNDLDHWRTVSRRPPSEESPFTTTYVALRGLNSFGTPDQRERIDRRFERVRGWLLATTPHDTEDRVFRLRALRESGAPQERVRGATQELLQAQRQDGGWAQLPDMESDAYATGSALVALHQAGGLAVDDHAYRRGLSYLISTQRDDGSWHVVSRSKPFQSYFESGYPHGKDQFISIAAGGWATTALALALPKTLPGGADISDGAADDTARKPKRVRLLTVGNSFSQDATRFLGDLVTAVGHVLIHHQATIGGGPGIDWSP